jgi:hypothetical protein
MVHIESEEDYEAIDELRSMINGRFSDDIRFPKLFRDRVLVDKLNKTKNTDLSLFKRICSLSLEVKKQAKGLNTEYRLLEKKRHPLGWLITGIAGIIAFFPLFVCGSIFLLTFLGIPRLQIRKIKDLQFHSSVRYGISLVLAIVLLPLYLVILLIFVPPWWLAMLIFIAFPLTGLFAWNYALVFRRIIGGFRIRKHLKGKDKNYLELKRNHDELMNLINCL